MGHSVTHESEDGVLSTDSHVSKDGDNIGGSSNGGIVFKKGPWTPAEDAILVEYVKKHGEGNWNAIQKLSGLSRCGKSCRLRWANHLRPNLKKGAFTSEEERLITELHVKMGNKWARMAAHLPGRTDNEIKNYWNTRIKKCRRSGLPVYPPELCPQAQPENQGNLNSPEICGGDKGCHDILQTGDDKAQDVMLNSLNIFPYTEEFPDISASGILINGFHCSPFHNIPGIIGWRRNTQNPNELVLGYGGGAAGVPSFVSVHTDICGDKVSQSFTPYFPYHPANTEQLLPIGINQDSHFMSNGFFSASKPFAGAEKMELPSLQHEEIGLGVWDTAPESLNSFLYSSVAVPLPSESDCPSPRNSGLLEALLDEAKALRRSSDKAPSSFFSTGYVTECSAVETCSPKLKSFIDFSSPSSKSIGSLFNECTPSHAVGSSSEYMPEAVDENWMLDGVSNEIFNQLYYSRPDVVLRSSSWLEQSGSSFK